MHNIPFFETSAKWNINVSEMFEDIMLRIMRENQKKIKEENVETDKIKENEESGEEGKKNGFCVLM